MSDDDCLFRAAQRGDLEAVRRLLHKGAPQSVFESALQVAVWNDHGEIVGEIVRLVTTGSPHRGMLASAARHGSASAAHVLIQCGAFSRLHIGRALQWAAQHGQAATTALLVPYNVSRAAALVSAAMYASTLCQGLDPWQSQCE